MVVIVEVNPNGNNPRLGPAIARLQHDGGAVVLAFKFAAGGPGDDFVDLPVPDFAFNDFTVDEIAPAVLRQVILIEAVQQVLGRETL